MRALRLRWSCTLSHVCKVALSTSSSMWIWANQPIHTFFVECLKPLPPRNQCTGWFALTFHVFVLESFQLSPILTILEVSNTPHAKSHLHLVGPPSLLGLYARIFLGIILCLKPMRQYPVVITNIQVDITFIVARLIDGVPSHAKGA